MKRIKYTNIHPTLQLSAAALLFLVTLRLSKEPLSATEIAIFQSIYGLPDILRPVFYAITQLGSIYALAALVLLYLVRQHYPALLRLLMTGTFAYLLAGFAKSIWGRPRPHELLPNISTLDYFQGPGFPSGHVALAVALALTLGHILPRKLHYIVVLWIIGVGLSRVYLGVHLPLDIIGGFAIGWFAYALFRHVRLSNIAFRSRP